MPGELYGLQNGHAAQAGTVTLSEAGATFEIEAVRSLHRHNIPWEQGTDVVVIRTVGIADIGKRLACTYTLFSNDGVPAPLGDIFSSVVHVWDIQAMLHLSTAWNHGHHGGKFTSEDEITETWHLAMSVFYGRCQGLGSQFKVLIPCIVMACC